ncbi:MAG: zeta toxin family protein [Thermodesulfobacteriota bacterium]
MTGKVIDTLKRATKDGAPILLVIAGPNGAGKTTFHDHFISPLGLPFVNADRIAQSQSPTKKLSGKFSYEAAKIADAERRMLLVDGKSFCMETVFSDPAGDKLKFLRTARKSGYSVILVFIGLECAELSLARVIQRVAGGGHNVPDDKLRERFPRSFDNLRKALSFVDHAFLFDNSSSNTPFRPVAIWESGNLHQTFHLVPAWAVPFLSVKKQVNRLRTRKSHGTK